MCGCSLSYFTNGFTGNDLIQDQSLRNTLADYKVISKSDFKQGKTLAILNYSFCLDQQQLISKFANIGIDINASLLPALASVIDSGGDKTGAISNRNNQPVYFDGLKMLREMTYTKDQIEKSQCSIILVP